MLIEAALLVCLLTILGAFLRQKKRLAHARYGSELITLGLLILVFGRFIDLLFVGDVSIFDIGFSNISSMKVWALIDYIPGLVIVAVGILRFLPAIEQLDNEIIARKNSERRQREQNSILKLATERAEMAENMLVDAIESMPEAVAIFNADDNLFICNYPYRERFKNIQDKIKPGIPFEKLIDLTLKGGGVPDATGREEEWKKQRLLEHRNPAAPIEQEFQDGRIYRLSETKTKSGGTVSIRTDITDILDRERALEENRAKLEEAQAIAHIGNWTHNRKNDTHEWSDEVFRILGYQPGEIEHSYKNFITRVHPNDVERLKSVFNLAWERQEAFEVEFRVVGNKGKITYVRLLGRLNLDEEGRMVGASGTLQDITAQHLFERELTQAKLEAEEGIRSKSLFLANMSHELRTPLNAVIGFSEVLAKEIFGPIENPKYREYADNIQSSGRHLLSLIDDILDYSRLEAGSMELKETEFNLLDLAQSTRTMLAAKAMEKSARISVSKELGLRIKADERKLKQVLINLVNNAIKFSPERGLIEINIATESAQYVSIYITDSGFGISKDEIENVMRPFGRAQHSVDKSIEGTGLGLPLAKSIVELHGGELKIAGNKDKPGTTIEIRLPKSRFPDFIRRDNVIPLLNGTDGTLKISS
ncbi:MAG: PAS-domain containing protein [Sneathiella sp.]|nr:PAS-domain containing protein [Sneathiella sp.]